MIYDKSYQIHSATARHLHYEAVIGVKFAWKKENLKCLYYVQSDNDIRIDMFPGNT